MKDIVQVLAVVLVFILIGGLGLAGVYRYATSSKSLTDSLLGGGFSPGQSFYITYTPNGDSLEKGEPTATSTIAYLAADTASTTVDGYIGRADSFDMELIFNASSTSAKLLWVNYFSQTDEATTSLDWMAEDCNTVTSNVVITHGVGTCVHTWTAPKAGINTRRITLDSIQANYLLTKFSLHGANGGLWVRVIPKEPTPN